RVIARDRRSTTAALRHSMDGDGDEDALERHPISGSESSYAGSTPAAFTGRMLHTPITPSLQPAIRCWPSGNHARSSIHASPGARAASHKGAPFRGSIITKLPTAVLHTSTAPSGLKAGRAPHDTASPIMPG